MSSSGFVACVVLAGVATACSSGTPVGTVLYDGTPAPSWNLPSVPLESLPATTHRQRLRFGDGDDAEAEAVIETVFDPGRRRPFLRAVRITLTRNRRYDVRATLGQQMRRAAEHRRDRDDAPMSSELSIAYQWRSFGTSSGGSLSGLVRATGRIDTLHDGFP